jgi:hypothetical protein
MLTQKSGVKLARLFLSMATDMREGPHQLKSQCHDSTMSIIQASGYTHLYTKTRIVS